MKTAIIGGAGFIGCNVFKRLKKEGYHTIIIDNFSTGRKSNLDKESTIYEADITDKIQLEEVFKKEKIINVIHLASKIVSSADEMIDVNLQGTINVMEFCKKYKVKKVVLASSAAIYGNTINPKLKMEERFKCEPIGLYGKTKYAQEKIALSYTDFFEVIILRLFNVYGLPFNNNVISNIVTKTPFNINGDGSQTRDFVYVKDIAFAFFLALRSVVKNGSVYNIGSGTKTTINELIKIIHPKKVIENEELNEIKHSWANIDKAKKELNYWVKYQIREGLTDMMG